MNDVAEIKVDSACQETYPCRHSSNVTLKDGRSVSHLTSFEIYSIISTLTKEKINSNENWGADDVKDHFSMYSQSIREMGWKAESPEVILNRLFSKK